MPGYEGLYEVSDLGQARSLGRFSASGHRRKGKLLAQTPNESGHRKVTLFNQQAKKIFGIHVLVLLAFAGPRPPLHEACHWNDDPADNRLGNLRWGTRSENLRDCVRNGHHGMANKTHCPSGHEYSLANTYVRPSGDRSCRECSRTQRRLYNEKNREERNAKNNERRRQKAAQKRDNPS